MIYYSITYGSDITTKFKQFISANLLKNGLLKRQKVHAINVLYVTYKVKLHYVFNKLVKTVNMF